MKLATLLKFGVSTRPIILSKRANTIITRQCRMTDADSYTSPQKKALLENFSNVASPRKPQVIDEQPVLSVQRLSENAKLPTRATPGSIGYDLYSAESKTIPARGRSLISTDIKIAIPEGCYARVAPRSGLALRHGIDTGAGVVDPDYRGTLGVVLFNLSDTDFKVEIGDRVAQLILERACVANVVEVQSLDETSRGEKGYGSTGQR